MIAQLPISLLAHTLAYLGDERRLRHFCRAFRQAGEMACREIMQGLACHPQIKTMIHRYLPPPQPGPNWSYYSDLLGMIRQIFLHSNAIYSLDIEDPKSLSLLELIEKADAVCFDRFFKKLGGTFTGLPSEKQTWIQGRAPRINTLDLSLKTCTVRSELSLLSNLTSLNMSYTNLWEIPDLQQAHGLKSLQFVNNSIEMIPEWFGHLNDLRVLDLSINPLKRLLFSPFPSGLCHLSLANCDLKRLPPIKNLKQLETLDLSSNQIRWLPRWIKQFYCLTSLSLADNPIRLCKEIGCLTELRSLNLSYLNLNRLPNWLRNLTVLESINLNGNLFTQLPPALIYFPYLKQLHMAHNKLKSIPFWIQNLQSLSLVDFTYNSLRYVPFEYFDVFPQPVTLYV